MKTINFFVFLILNVNFLCSNTDQTQNIGNKSEKVTINKNIDNTLEEKVNLISENHKKLINTIFTEVPLYTLKLQGAYKKAQEVLNEMSNEKSKLEAFNKKYDTEEKQLIRILQKKEEILKPVKQLFPVLHKKAYRSINEPLFINMLLDEETKNKIKIKTNKNEVSLEDVFEHMENNQIPVALKFLKVDEKSSDSYFENYITDKETLIECCKELESLFGPLNKILTPETKKNAVDFYRNLLKK